ncbi:MAG: cation-translocating P-type ATPase [Candidatus Micrarchaeia archaeon]
MGSAAAAGKSAPESDFFSAGASRCLSALGSSPGGLSESHAAARLAKYGFNELAGKEKRSGFEVFLSQFDDLMIRILILAAMVSFAVSIDYARLPAIVVHGEEALDAAAILAIVLLNAVFGFVQERRAEKAVEALKKMMAPTARVLRGGGEQIIPARLLVPGDVVVIGEGDKVPADLRILSSKSLEADQSSLTGESVPVSKEASDSFEENVLPAERKNALFMSTVVVRGHGTAFVFATGMGTQIGRVSALVAQQPDEQTPLQKKLGQLGKSLGAAAFATVLMVFALGILEGRPLLEMFLTGVSLAVAAIPEGLPAVVTIALALGVQRMAKRHAIIRKLPAVETLGSATVICSDKTGTLTKNEMTVRKILVGASAEYDVSGKGYCVSGAFSAAGTGRRVSPKELLSARAARLMLDAAVLCNNARLVWPAGKGECGIAGDPTEGSLLVLAAKAELGEQGLREQWPLLDEVPFDSQRKMMSVLVRPPRGEPGLAGKSLLFSKGAPEVILSKCDKILSGASVPRPLSDKERKALLSKNAEFAQNALRVIAFAYRELPPGSKKASEQNERGLVFLGFAGMMDPPREEVREAVRVCNEAGIKVVMITGDNEVTALAVARELGIAKDTGLRVVTGRELEGISDADLEKLAQDIGIYARVNPEHKLRIVNALKAHGHVVAMTGDGVNDAPALKRADIGIAMGITGTDVAKESSKMVLADDNFASIVSAVEEGRIIYDNILKAVKFLIACNISELLLLFLGLLSATLVAGLPVPLIPLQILWMNLVTDSLPALALASEPSEPDVMRRKPRDSGEQILSKSRGANMLFIGTVIAVCTLILFTAVFLQNAQLGPEMQARKAQTVAFTTIIFFQFAFAFSARSEHLSLLKIGLFRNRFLMASIAVSALLQLLVIYHPLAQGLFNTVALSAAELAACVLISLLVIFAHEAHKWARRSVAG